MNGTISIKKVKKGFIAEIDGKPLQLSEFDMKETDHGKDCTYEVVAGRVSKISVAGQERPKKPPKQHANQGHRNNFGGQQSNRTGPRQNNNQQQAQNNAPQHTARAPYNFIPLNESVVEFDKAPAMDCYHSDRHTGYIDLTIETLTPFYIRGTSDDPKNDCHANPEFFSPGDILKIPGSSLRGMVRTLMEIVTFGKFQCDDRQLFFRNIADQNYRNTMIDSENNCFPKAKAGLLIRRQGRYFILPSQIISGTDHYRINGRFTGSDFSIPEINGRLPQFSFRPIYFKPVAPMNHSHTDSSNKQIPLRYALVTEVSDTPKEECTTEGYLIISGKFSRKKHMQWIVNKPDGANEIEIPDPVVKQYKDDVTREEKADLFAMLNQHQEVPCFYLTDSQGQVCAFGHTAIFRHPYQYSIRQHLDPKLYDEQSVDCTDAVFGKLEQWAGRVFFEDADLQSGQQNVLMDATSPKVLSSPKPTTFQHYLEPNNDRYQQWGTQAAKLRGYKLYWHRDTQQPGEYHWSENRRIENDSQHTVISPVRPNTHFTGRIRFENLTSEELGALLFVLHLPGTCRHKLGMAKPLGLGSVKITPRLVLSDRESRYRGLFDDTSSNWAVPEKQIDMRTAISAFESFMIGKLSASEKGNAVKLWDTHKLQALKTMLDWAHTNKPDWNENTRYMEIEREMPHQDKKENEYKKRPILPLPAFFAK